MKNSMPALMRLVLFTCITTSSIKVAADDSTTPKEPHKNLVVYFSQPEDVSLDGVDAVSGASLLRKNQQNLGATQYIAKLIEQKVGADIYPIEPAQPYPRDHKPLVDFAQQEKRNRVRPAIKHPLPDLEQYDTVFIGYPIWWYQMPMILYTFLEENDFSGKKVIPFSTHGGSRLSGTVREIIALQPNAHVETDAFSISRDDVADSSTPEEVYEWLDDIEVK
ncbi:flavodoxin [Vibrio albus]|uniref:Flavodoxin n=1 Tax=Vibrio albus TaxID=2200953 RepID=A0A2U3B9H1_9VIBR|nr:flavodoxin [Vibrio albus]PWI33421.1 flavodoxin [Vibrio albus]